MKPHVALLVETSSVYGREVLAGIMQYLRLHEDWSVYLQQRDLQSSVPEWLQQWTGDGIISRSNDVRLRDASNQRGIPFLDLMDRSDDIPPHVRSNDAMIGSMAADHLLAKDFRQFGFCGFEDEAWSRRRQLAFADAVHQRLGDGDAAAAKCDVFESRWLEGAASWDVEQNALADWVTQLPKPCGILACNDLRGQQVLDACDTAGLSVPEEVAVIGVDNDELVCEFARPPLTSIVPDATAVGFEAARQLSEMMQGKRPLGAPTLESQVIVAPRTIQTRLSTDVVAIDHPGVVAALAYIREHACSGLTVDKVLESVDVSRSTLERQVRRYLGRTPQQEIRHVQLKRVRQLLRTTNLSAEQIAHRAGFDHPEYMHYVFKRDLGMTPGQYRQNAH
ncbi:MAG: DNA-binding transcriptional regulator [Planctomycetota bacterium]